MIKIYSTPSCVYCRGLKEYLKSKGFDYNEVDVSVDQKELEEMVEISGQMGVPVIDIDGNVVIGFDKERVDEILEIKE